MAVVQGNFNLVQSGPREAGSGDQVLDVPHFIDNGVDQGRLADIGRADEVDVLVLAVLVQVVDQSVQFLLLGRGDQENVLWVEAHPVGFLPHPVLDLAFLGVLREEVQLVADQDKVICADKALQRRNQRVGEVKQVHHVDDQGLLFRHGVQKC